MSHFRGQTDAFKVKIKIEIQNSKFETKFYLTLFRLLEVETADTILAGSIKTYKTK